MKTMLPACIYFAAFFTASLADISENDRTGLRELFQMFGQLNSADRAQSILLKEASKGSRQLGTFQWKDCGEASYPSKVESITVSPDPMRLPGNVNIGFKGKLNVALKAPLTLKVEIQKKVVFWVPVPCLGQFGSCTYDDVCQLIPKFGCPPIFQKYGIPCECPIKEGTYSLPPSQFYIDDSSIPSALADGHYRATAHLKQGDQDISCVHVEFAITKA